MKTFKQFLTDEIANTTGNVQGMRTEPVVRRRDQVKYFRRKQPIAMRNVNCK